jgi:hypothetical protein
MKTKFKIKVKRTAKVKGHVAGNVGFKKTLEKDEVPKTRP